MKGLKSKLLFAFISIIVLPVIVSILFFLLFSANLEKGAVNNEQQIDQFLFQLRSQISEMTLEEGTEDYDYLLIKPLLEEYEMDVFITSNDGKVRFDSRSFQGHSIEPGFTSINPFHLQVEINSGELVNVEVISHSSEVAPFSLFSKMIMFIFISIAAGFLVLIGLMAGWIWYFSNTVLTPLREMYIATEHIRNGDLDYPIKFDRHDEIGRFISGFNHMRSHIKKANKEKEQFEQARKELIASISHDLRTPLSSIKGYVEGLTDGVVQDEQMQKRYLAVIQAKTNQMDHLINDLFDYSKLELDQLAMNKHELNSNRFFEMVVEESMLEVIEKNKELTVAGSIPSVTLNIDPVRINQVFTNLIDNAVRYGGEQLGVSFRVESDQFIVQISDNGEGVRDEDLRHLFEIFYRSDKSRSNGSGGTGLGLTIAKQIVDAHGGRIWCESIQGVGTTFTFTLPIK